MNRFRSSALAERLLEGIGELTGVDMTTESAKTALISFTLGCFTAFGVVFCIVSSQINPFSLYLSFLALSHFLEYLPTSLYRPKELSVNSFLLNHSRDYHIAVASACVEYWIEYFVFNSLKTHSIVSWIGLVVAIAGQLIRSIGIFTCGKNFNHHVQDKKDEEHQLVTAGIYKYLRHPSYTGYFYWAVGLQLMLMNPVCSVGFAIVLSKFFKDRIEYEEECLIDFFSKDYEKYQQSTFILIP